MEFRSNKLEGTVNLVNDKDQEKNDCEKLREKRSCQNENLLIAVYTPSLRTTTSSDKNVVAMSATLKLALSHMEL